MKIILSQKSILWTKKYNICPRALKQLLITLCKKEGVPTNKNLYIKIKPRSCNSEFDISRNVIVVGIDTQSANPHSIIRRMIRNLLHELRHYIQYKIKKRKAEFSYSYLDLIRLSDRYWYAPEEIDARKYERRKLNFVFNRLMRASFLCRRGACCCGCSFSSSNR